MCRYCLAFVIVLGWASVAYSDIFVSLKSSRTNMRVGPGLEYPIRLQLQTPNAPMRLLDRYGDWRKLTSPNGHIGWVHHSLISTRRTVAVNPVPKANRPTSAQTTPAIRLYAAPSQKSRIQAFLAKGLVAALKECTPIWCHINIVSDDKTYNGWVQRTQLWGLDEAD